RLLSRSCARCCAPVSPMPSERRRTTERVLERGGGRGYDDPPAASSYFERPSGMRKGNCVSIEPKEAYDELIRRSRELATLASCSAILGWDEQTYMPAGGATHRGNQMALLAGLQHERATDPRIGELLTFAEGSALVAEPDSVEGANVRE